MSDLFTDWLSQTKELQTKSFGADPSKLDSKAAIEYLRWNSLAAVKELMEALDETDWKPWTVTDNGILDRSAYVEELVDVMHFIANMLVTVDATDEEVSRVYAYKMQVNRDRMASGTYKGRGKQPVASPDGFVKDGVEYAAARYGQGILFE